MTTAPSSLALRATIAAAALLGSALVAAPAEGTASSAARGGNPTGVKAGSRPNGVGNLAVSLRSTADGQIQVRWRRPAPPSKLKNFVVKVGVNRQLNHLVRKYRVSSRAQSLVVGGGRRHHRLGELLLREGDRLPPQR